ncbi:MAG TPA: PQQ-dependent sugar dehydrogenase [Verrucomicrobiota bacterium]|nr:hypothetical protein [Verrucomicrobiales bacterium]HRI12720.1 PQQ-dependent sugar dehydrogenase [Verrucomicrobiota bacterium]
MKFVSFLFTFMVASAVRICADSPKIALKLIAEDFTQPLAYVPLPENHALVVDQPGLVWLIAPDGTRRPEPVLNLTNKLSAINHGAFDERGLIDLALHPKFSANRRVLVTYTAPRRASAPADWDCTLRLSEFTLPAALPLRIDPASEKVILEIDKPYANHNSGRLAFGPDGLLYLSVGDGGNANDEGKRPETGNGQNLQTHLGKVLRLDVDRTEGEQRYAIPTDNPFAGSKDGLPEIYAYGLRNIWGLSFDRGGTRELFAADVGQNLLEEVDIIVKGGNYGWSLREGFSGFSAKSPNTSPTEVRRTGLRGEPLVEPILQYKHAGPKKDPEALGISITGGFIYRGRALPELVGQYVFGDWSRSWGLPQGVLLSARRPATNGERWSITPLEVVQPEKFAAYITAFGQDSEGELFVMTNGSNSLTPGKGKLWKLVPPPKTQ